MDEETACDAVQVIAELACNAVRHSQVPGRRFRVRITDDGSRLQLEVDDAGHTLPTAAEPPDDAEHGRGLQLVTALADTWGVFSRPHGIGKSVWAIIPYARPAER